MKIAFYFSEGEQDYNDLSQVDVLGNPGVGGTGYAFVTIATLLAKRGAEIDEVLFYHTGKWTIDKSVHSEVVSEVDEAVRKAVERGIEIFILKTIPAEKYIKILNDSRLKIVLWPSNFLMRYEMDWISKCDNVKKVVWVGRQHYDYYMDSWINEISYYIYNPVIPWNKTNTPISSEERFNNKIVTYMGALIKAKGFHHLAKAWKEIINKVPDAKLHVVGTAKLYHKDNKLGSYGISDEMYEQEFIKYLLDDNGNIMESVFFDGLLGYERFDLLQNTTVGVPNPSGYTETFCFSAAEMEMMGVPLVTGKHWGLLDTVKNNICGLMVYNPKRLAKAIIELLSNKNLNMEFGKNAQQYVLDRFDADTICNEWIKLLKSIDDDDNLRIEDEFNYDNIWYDCKWLRIMNRAFKKFFHLHDWPAVYEWHIILSNLKSRLLNIINII